MRRRAPPRSSAPARSAIAVGAVRPRTRPTHARAAAIAWSPRPPGHASARGGLHRVGLGLRDRRVAIGVGEGEEHVHPLVGERRRSRPARSRSRPSAPACGRRSLRPDRPTKTSMTPPAARASRRSISSRSSVAVAVGVGVREPLGGAGDELGAAESAVAVGVDGDEVDAAGGPSSPSVRPRRPPIGAALGGARAAARGVLAAAMPRRDAAGERGHGRRSRVIRGPFLASLPEGVTRGAARLRRDAHGCAILPHSPRLAVSRRGCV